jgi:hypothetical protein
MGLFFAHLNGVYANKTLFEPEDLLHLMRILRAYDVGRAADGSRLREPPITQ